MSWLLQCRPCDGPEEDLKSATVEELIREHHALVMRTLQQQQATLDSMRDWHRADGLAPDGDAVHLPHKGSMSAPNVEAGDPLIDTATANVSLEQLDHLQDLVQSSAVSLRVPETTHEEAPLAKSRIASRIQARVHKTKLLKQLTRMEKLQSFVEEGPLDLLAGAVILINAGVLIVEQQMQGSIASRALDMEAASGSLQISADTPDGFEVAEYVFLAFYLCEMVLRVGISRKRWYYTEEEGYMWGNYFDFLLVGSGVVDALLVANSRLRGDSYASTQILRLLKITKVVKTMRLVRVMHLFSPLRSMVDVFRASLSALFWSVMMLLVCMMIASLILCEACFGFIVDATQDRDVRENLLKTYGSFTRSMYTFFEITFSGGWPNLIRPLVDDVSVYFAIPCLIYVVVVVFAALRLIAALFVRSTLHTLSNDAGTAVLERLQHTAELQAKLTHLFEDADLDNDQSLSLAEWEKLLRHPEIVHYLSTLEVDVHDARMLFQLLDDGDGRLSVQEFCEGIPKVRGNAKSLDIVCLLHETGKIRKECQEILSAVQSAVQRKHV